MANQIDVLLNNNNKGYYDINIADNGDLETTSGLDTMLTLAFYTNKRADSTEVSDPLNRSGWWGNVLSETDFEIGSKVWLLQSDIITNATATKARGYASDAYQFLIDQKLVDDIIVTSSITTQKITMNIKTVINSDVSSVDFDLWAQTNVT